MRSTATMVFTHPMSKGAGELFDRAVSLLGVTAGSRFMFTGHAALDGASPIEALKRGRRDDVKRVILNLRKEPT